ncbi:MAG: PspA/IM30 family protein [Planctomycetota bacterium]|nr:MAG: PspA/IM30 family protein [Planctomycetota bacterium]
MWERLKRVFRSMFGSAVEAMENPEAILKQNIRDLEDQVPKMNESIAMIRANQTLLERELDKLARTERELAAKIKAALKSGRRDLAMGFATRLEQVRSDKAQTAAQLEAAREAYDKALHVKQAFMRAKEAKVREATRALQASRRSEWQKKVADALESFQVAGIDATHDEMVQRLEQKAALGEARLEMALDSLEVQDVKIEQAAQELEANATLLEFERELGLAPPRELPGGQSAAAALPSSG